MNQNLVKKPVVALIAAIVLAAAASAVYDGIVSSEFIPIRVNVLGEEASSSHRVLAITLPDLSSLRGQTAVLGFRLRNYGVEQRRVGVVRDGFPRNRVVLPPDQTIRWEIVLAPEIVNALDRAGRDAARSLELNGDADGWAVNALEIRNYHVRAGTGVMAAVIPRSAEGYTTGTGFLPVSMALCVLAVLNALAWPKLQRQSLRLAGNGLTLAAFLVCVTCLLLPRIAPYKVVLSPWALVVLAAALFAPLILYVLYGAPTFLATVPSIAVRHWARHEVTFERSAALLGLAAIAIAQPIFEVISNSPEFFAARGTTPAVAIAAVLAICLGLPLSLIAIERAMRVLTPRAAALFHGLVLAALSAAVMMPWFRHTNDFISPSEGVIGALAGLAVAVAYVRIRIVRQFLTALAPAAVVVPALFMLNSDVQRNFLPSESAAAVDAVARTPPIVLVVFDELPLNSLLDREGSIDAGRYPNFSALAREAHWFRNAATVWHNTSYAVPAILSGRYPPGKAVPTLRYYPVNLFTALARHYDIFASMRYQQLCPPRACQDKSAMPGDTVRSLVSDLGLVWLHIVLPQALTDELPPVEDDWADFGGMREVRAGPSGASGRGGVFAHFVSAIDRRPARLYFIHSMVPHMPFEYVPSGRRYRAPDPQTRNYRGAALFQGRSAAYADTLHQRHLAQVGFVDRLLGDLIARLRDTGVYDEALVIITSDHGASYREGRSRRAPQRQNVSDVVGVPLFIKLPGQRRGEVVDRVVETVDIFPTILDVLGVEASLRLDGSSLIDATAPERSLRPFLLRARYKTAPSVEDVAADRAASLERKDRRFGRGDRLGLYAPPDARHLLGTRMSRTIVQPDVHITIRDAQQFASVDRSRDVLPLYVQGILSTTRREPLTVAVEVNGSVAAVTRSYRDRNAQVFGVLIPETSLRDGTNTVAAHAVDGLPVKD